MSSSKESEARPVRTLLRSRLNDSRALVIPALALDLTSAIIVSFSFDNGSDLVATNDTFNIAAGRQIKHEDRQVVVHTKGCRRRVHHLKTLLEDIQIRQLLVFDGIFVFRRIRVVNSVNFGRFENNFSTDYDSTQARCRVGREKRIAGARAKNNNTPFFEMANSPAADIWLSDLLHFNGGLDPGDRPRLFQGILQRQAVHDRGQHPHVVGTCTVHPHRGCGNSAEDIAAANDDGNLDTKIDTPANFDGDRPDNI